MASGSPRAAFFALGLKNQAGRYAPYISLQVLRLNSWSDAVSIISSVSALDDDAGSCMFAQTCACSAQSQAECSPQKIARQYVAAIHLMHMPTLWTCS